MTSKELQQVQAEYRQTIIEEYEAPEDLPHIITGFCSYLASEMCFNHHERGQRLWAFFQALKELQEEAERCRKCQYKKEENAHGQQE